MKYDVMGGSCSTCGDMTNSQCFGEEISRDKLLGGSVRRWENSITTCRREVGC
jgi:hypothetical protein